MNSPVPSARPEGLSAPERQGSAGHNHPMSVSVQVVYEGALRCSVTHGPSGQVTVTDAPEDNGGRGAAISPTDMVAAAYGSCVLTIIGLAARRESLDVTGTRITVVKEMTAQPARRIASLKANLAFPSRSSLTQAEKAKLLAAAKACPVRQSLHPDVEVSLEVTE